MMRFQHKMSQNQTTMFNEHPAKVEDGNLKIENKALFNACVRKFEGKRLRVILKKYKTIRSLAQNRYYWKIVVSLMAKEWKCEEEQAHEALKSEFNPDVNAECPFKVGKTTTNLSTTEFNIYLERIAIYASEQGILIPTPEDAEAEWLSKNVL